MEYLLQIITIGLFELCLLFAYLKIVYTRKERSFVVSFISVAVYILSSICWSGFIYLTLPRVIKNKDYMSLNLSVHNLQVIVIAEIIKYLLIMIVYYKIVTERSEKRPESQLIALILPAFSGICLLLTRNTGVLWNSGRVSDRMGVLLTILILNAISFAFIISKDITYRRQLEMQTVGQVDKYKEKYYQKVEDSQIEVRRIRHNMKNQLLMLQGRLDDDDYEEVRIGLNKLINKIIKTEQDYYTANKDINMIINAKGEDAKATGIKWDVKVSVPENIRLDNIDLGILLGNTFDNAIEACGRLSDGLRYIHSELLYFNHSMTIYIENSVNVDAVYVNSTSKQDKKNHGHGLKSVEHVVKKYNGSLEYEILNSSFRLRIMLWNV